MKNFYVIYDWANNDVFGCLQFTTFDGAESHLVEFLGVDYEACRGEYHIQEFDLN